MDRFERAMVAMEILTAFGDEGYHAYVNCHPTFLERNPGGFAVLPNVDTWQMEPAFQVCPERLLDVAASLDDEDFIRFCGAVRRLQRGTIIDVLMIAAADLVFAKFEQERPDDAAVLREVAAVNALPIEQFTGLLGRDAHGVMTTSLRQYLIMDRLYKFCDADPRVFGVALSRATWPVSRPQDALGWAPPQQVDPTEPMRFAFCPEVIDSTTEWIGGEGDLLPDYLNVIEVFVSGYLGRPNEDPQEVQRSIESYLYEEAPDHLRLLSEIEGAVFDAQYNH